MATINDLGVEYAGYIRLNQDNPHVASEIVERISELTYTSNGQPLSPTDRDGLISAIATELRTPRTRDGRLLKEAEDISALLAMVDKIKAMIKR